MSEDEDKDKRDLWRMLKDPLYAVWIPVNKEIKQAIDEREAEEKEQLTDAMKKLNSKLGWIDDE